MNEVGVVAALALHGGQIEDLEIPFQGNAELEKGFKSETDIIRCAF